MTEVLLGRLAETTAFAPLLGFAVGVALSLSPVSLPALTVSVAALAPGQLDTAGKRKHMPLHRSFLVLAAFVMGMDGLFAAAGYALVSLTVALTRASVVLHLLAGAVLTALGLRLLSRRSSLCNRATAMPPHPSGAFLFGALFSVTGCPGCGPVVIGLSSVAVIVAGPSTALVALAAFLLGRTLTLLAAARAGSHLLPIATEQVAWTRLDVLVGGLFMAAGAYYLVLVATGQVTTILPGEAGRILP
ncbi:MAG: cytochrome c biogenesis protein CcdA [Egibacteraceae bacterium]